MTDHRLPDAVESAATIASALRPLAERATPGPWRVTRDPEREEWCVTTAEDTPWWIARAEPHLPHDEDGAAHMAYLAACSPERVLALCEAARLLDVLERAVRGAQRGVAFDFRDGRVTMWEPLDGEIPDGWCLSRAAESVTAALAEAFDNDASLRAATPTPEDR